MTVEEFSHSVCQAQPGHDAQRRGAKPCTCLQDQRTFSDVVAAVRHVIAHSTGIRQHDGESAGKFRGGGKAIGARRLDGDDGVGPAGIGAPVMMGAAMGAVTRKAPEPRSRANVQPNAWTSSTGSLPASRNVTASIFSMASPFSGTLRRKSDLVDSILNLGNQEVFMLPCGEEHS